MKTVFGEDVDGRRAGLWKICFESHDAPVKKRVAAELDLKALAEV